MNSANLEIRQELPDDFALVEKMYLKAYGPEAVAYWLIPKLRPNPYFVADLDFIALHDGHIIGGLMNSRCRILNKNGLHVNTCIYLEPFGILPEYRHRGYGSLLINRTIDRATQLGYRAIFLSGPPLYFKLFGFTPSRDFNISTDEGENPESFLVLPLFSKALEGINGRLYISEIFHQIRFEF